MVVSQLIFPALFKSDAGAKLFLEYPNVMMMDPTVIKKKIQGYFFIEVYR